MRLKWMLNGIRENKKRVPVINAYFPGAARSVVQEGYHE